MAEIHSTEYLYRTLTLRLIAAKRTVTVMESCTGGCVASLITDTEGSSEIFKGSMVAYSNEAKVLFNVPDEIISHFGVYSEETAAAMADACRETFQADLGIGVTGNAGNVDPANPEGTPGQVFFAIASDDDIRTYYMSVPPELSRHAFKETVARGIAEQLLSHPSLE